MLPLEQCAPSGRCGTCASLVKKVKESEDRPMRDDMMMMMMISSKCQQLWTDNCDGVLPLEINVQGHSWRGQEVEG